MVEFEIGLVYQKGNRLFIAIDPSTLVSFRGGAAAKIRPNTQYGAVRSCSVEKLCEQWEITLDEFDAEMSQYLFPQQTTKTRPRGQRRTKGKERDYWRRHRTGRIARPKL
jgi:hypothetical protein